MAESFYFATVDLSFRKPAPTTLFGEWLYNLWLLQSHPMEGACVHPHSLKPSKEFFGSQGLAKKTHVSSSVWTQEQQM